MTFLITLLYFGAALCAVVLWRTWLRWQRIGARPVLSCAEVADAEPGTFVTVAGCTAGSPTSTSPLLSSPCVWYEVSHHWSRFTNSISIVHRAWGDPGLYGDRGEPVRIEPELGKRSLLAARSAMITGLAWETDEERSYYPAAYDRRFERTVPPDTPVVVTGVVRLVDGDLEARQLCRADWVDGSAHARLDELPGRYTRFIRWMVALLLAFLAFAVLLTGTS